MELTTEQIAQLKSLLEQGIITQDEYDNKINPPEPFSVKKLFKGMATINSKVLWSKDITGIFNLRKVIIYSVVILAIFGYGLWKGKRNTPIILPINESFLMKIDETHYLHWNKEENSLHVQENPDDKAPGHITILTIKDIPALYTKLKPIGLQFKPFFTAGGSIGDKKITGVEAGAGIDFFKFYKLRLNAWLTQMGVYAGPSYQVTNNFGLLGGVGKGFSEGDSRVFLGGKWNF
jgi:hypothetical protein